MIRARLLGLALLALAGCKRNYQVGDHVYVDWEGGEYPAVIKEQVGPSKFKVHFDGYEEIWDETVVKDRIKRLVEGPAIQPEPPAKVRARALKAAQTNQFKVGDRVRVDWHGHVYPATITAIIGPERYRVHFEGYGPEWDDNVELQRIQSR